MLLGDFSKKKTGRFQAARMRIAAVRPDTPRDPGSLIPGSFSSAFGLPGS
jgi:hypothetical protein